MDSFSLHHLSDAALIREFRTSLLQVREGTALLLAQIAEIDARRLFAPAGYSSMFLYCVREFHFSEDAAWRRIQAARAARRFPAIFQAVKEGRLHLTAICLIAPHLTAGNLEELIRAATHQSRVAIQAWLARRFPQALPPPARERIRLVQPAPARVKQETTVLFGGHTEPPGSLLSGHVEASTATERGLARSQRSTEPADPSVFDMKPPSDTESVPVVAARYVVQVTISGDTHEKLQHARALLSHVVGTDVAQVIDRALDALIERLESKKAGLKATNGPEPRGTSLPGPKNTRRQLAHPGVKHTALPGEDGNGNRGRYIPREVRREVWKRDGGRCTFVGPDGQRCEEQWFLEFDHVKPLAHGGAATVEGLRLRCRAHNQLEADRAFGSNFMQRKRQDAKERRAEIQPGNEHARGDGRATEGAAKDVNPNPSESAAPSSSRAPT